MERQKRFFSHFFLAFSILCCVHSIASTIAPKLLLKYRRLLWLVNPSEISDYAAVGYLWTRAKGWRTLFLECVAIITFRSHTCSGSSRMPVSHKFEFILYRSLLVCILLSATRHWRKSKTCQIAWLTTPLNAMDAALFSTLMCKFFLWILYLNVTVLPSSFQSSRLSNQALDLCVLWCSKPFPAALRWKYIRNKSSSRTNSTIYYCWVSTTKPTEWTTLFSICCWHVHRWRRIGPSPRCIATNP